MPIPTPVFAGDLADFPGAPFTDSAVAIAVAEVQAACRWHVAPQVTETVVVDTPEVFACGEVGLRLLQLPTMHLVSVTAVRDVTDPANIVAITDYSGSGTRDFRAGLLSRGWWCRWPLSSTFEVDIVHGYSAWPSDLLPAVAAVAQDLKVDQSTGTVRVGQVSITPNGAAVDTGIARAVNRYKLPLVP